MGVGMGMDMDRDNGACYRTASGWKRKLALRWQSGEPRGKADNVAGFSDCYKAQAYATYSHDNSVCTHSNWKVIYYEVLDHIIRYYFTVESLAIRSLLT